MTTARRWTQRLLLLVVSTALSLLLVDGAFRLYENHFLIHEIGAAAPVYDLALYEYNDHEGFLERRRGPEELRILSFGDSFAESVTLPRFTYAKVLQDELGSRARERRVRVVNLGRNGTSFPDYLSQLRIWEQQVEFDAVLLNLYAGNDFKDLRGQLFVAGESERHRERAAGEARRYGPGTDIPKRHLLRVFDHLHAILFTRAYASGEGFEAELYQPRALQYPRERYLETQASQLDVHRPDLMENYFDAYFWLYKLMLGASELERRGVRVAITLAPPHFAVSKAWRKDVLAHAGLEPERISLELPGMLVAALARDAGLRGPVLDLGPCLRAADERGEEIYWGTNTHWSVRGNQIVGRLLADAVAEPWLGPQAGTAAPPACSLAPAPVTPEVRARLDDALIGIRDLLDFEQSTLSGLFGQEYGDHESLIAALEAAGLRHDPERVKGEFLGYAEHEGDALIRPHGLRRFVRPHGWAVDSELPDEPVFVAFVHRGQLLGVGLTREPAAADLVLPHPRGLDLREKRVAFEALIRKPTPRVRRPEEMWVLAISSRGRFALLPYGRDALAAGAGG